ncbi:uncharacterized protein LOC119368772 isoform X2 [Triticum dicoccoides]|uniref:uncharacterized protein LOC119368772 isoform X2 n=1 Tax=Triticum dicoccoides TaxID=85692 RepID=UPI00188FFAFE|nr:uncharacterized protein LOC119368772 isoform X2 [Triticum dicoccoides]
MVNISLVLHICDKKGLHEEESPQAGWDATRSEGEAIPHLPALMAPRPPLIPSWPYPLQFPILILPISDRAAIPWVPRTDLAREMVGGARRGARARRLRPAHQVATPPQPPPPVATLPEIDASSPEALAEMRRVVREIFPNRSKWPDIFMEILRHAAFEERARFAGDDGGMDFEFIFWAIQEAESSDPRQAARWARFKTSSLSRLNIRPPPVLQISRIPPEALPPGAVLPRVP